MSPLTGLLIRHEGIRLKPYRDTVGKLTIGVGRNLDDVGISREEAIYLLAEDISEAQTGLSRGYEWFDRLDSVRRDALTDLAFMGLGKLATFQRMLAACGVGDWQTAHDELLQSAYARQVGQRAVDLATMLLTGQYPPGIGT